MPNTDAPTRRPQPPDRAGDDDRVPTSQGPAPTAPGPAPTDTIGSWLDRLVRLTRLPPAEAEELREELDAHLRERVRDLMLTGHDEPDAVHKSISELGDLAQLAQRYREASRTPRRRLVMNIAMIAVASTALGLSTLALRQSQPETGGPPTDGSGTYHLDLLPESAGPDGQGTYRIGVVPGPEVFEGLARLGLVPEAIDDRGNGTYSIQLQHVEPADDSPASSLRINPFLRHDAGAPADPSQTISDDVDRAPLAGVLDMLAESQDLRPYIHWRDIDAEAEAELSDLPLAGQQLGRAFDMLNDALGLDGQSTLEYRDDDGLFEVASRSYFDQRERELVTYDIGHLVSTENPLEVTEEAQTLSQLIFEIVEPEVWPENGGNAATISAVGGKLFVNAPPRVHERVVWLLQELAEDRTSALPPPADEARVVQVYALAHAASEQIAGEVSAALNPLGAQVRTDRDSNAVIVSGTRPVLAAAGSMIRALDRHHAAQD